MPVRVEEEDGGAGKDSLSSEKEEMMS